MLNKYRKILKEKGLVPDNCINDAFLVRNVYGKANWVHFWQIELDMIPDYVFTER